MSKQALCLHKISKKPSYCFCALASALPQLIFVLENIQKMPTLHAVAQYTSSTQPFFAYFISHTLAWYYITSTLY